MHRKVLVNDGAYQVFVEFHFVDVLQPEFDPNDETKKNFFVFQYSHENHTK